MRGAVFLGMVLAACASGAVHRDDVKAHLVAPAADAGSTQVDATVELSFEEGGGRLTGAWVTVEQDAPEGVHLRLALKDADGNPVVTDRLVALCAGHAMRGERVFVPLDETVLSDVTAHVAAAEVTFAARVGGCLRPTLRMETLLRPAGAR